MAWVFGGYSEKDFRDEMQWDSECALFENENDDYEYDCDEIAAARDKYYYSEI